MTLTSIGVFVNLLGALLLTVWLPHFLIGTYDSMVIAFKEPKWKGRLIYGGGLTAIITGSALQMLDQFLSNGRP